MALFHNNITVGTTVTEIARMPNGVGKVQVSVYNTDTNSIFIGDSAITVSAGSNQGLTVPRNALNQFYLSGNDVLYAISAAGTSTGAVVVMFSA